MKKLLFFLLGIFILFFGALFLWRKMNHIPVTSKPVVLRPSEIAVIRFAQGNVTGLKYIGQATDPNQAGEIVDHYTDSLGRVYDVQFSTNSVVIYLATNIKPDTTKPVITFSKAQVLAKQIMGKNMPGFDTFAKTATYYPEQSSGLYIMNWVGNMNLTPTQKAYFQQKGIQPAQYHMQVVLDRYGNLRNFDNEFLGNG